MFHENWQGLTYKDLDGAAAGSADLVKYDYILDTLNIPVETLPYDENQALEEQGFTSTHPSHDVFGHLTAELTPQDTEVNNERGLREVGSSEKEEYLESQDGAYFSYEHQVAEELVDEDVDNSSAAGQTLEGEEGENSSEGQWYPESGWSKTLQPDHRQKQLGRNVSSSMLEIEQTDAAGINHPSESYARGGRVRSPAEARTEEEGEHDLDLLEGIIRDASDGQYSSTGTVIYGIE